jgi:aminomethyltransferase
MGQVLITGPSAAEKLSCALTQDSTALSVGKAKYGFLLNESGGVVDDTIIMRLGENEFFLIVNAGTKEHDLEVISPRLAGLKITHLTDWAKLDIQGPRSAEVVKKFVECDLNALKYFGVMRTKFMGIDCILSRTGYTGELGYELFLPQEFMPGIFDTLLENPLVKPAGLGSRDSLRLEMAYPLYGHELSETLTPKDADMEFFYDSQRNFTGANALRNYSPARKLVAMVGESRRQFHNGDEITHAGKTVGYVTSGAFSPSLNVAIGMGYVDQNVSQTGCELVVKTQRAELPIKVSDKPIYANGTCRNKVNL